MSATILSFPKPFRPTRFSITDRTEIMAAAMAISSSWSAVFYLAEDGDELASIGRQAGGDGAANDAFGLSRVPRGVELADFSDASMMDVYASLEAALAALRARAARR